METLRLDGTNPHHVALAGEILRRGGIVAIPTETVYGLAASALDASAARKIFAAKGRPSDNPLIVHISHMAQLEDVWRTVPHTARTLAGAFWPGPLSLVLPRSARVPDAVTGGLDTVGVRMPRHPVARAVIRAAGVPLAAPSANISGRPSATTAAHVLHDFDGKIDAVVDGGPCGVGVESTVVSLVDGTVILRPGTVTEADIAAVLGAAPAARHEAPAGEAPLSPGMKYTHYATRAPITLYTGAPRDTARALLARRPENNETLIAFEDDLPRLREVYPTVLSFGPSWDTESHARRLFALLRKADRADCGGIDIQCPRPFGRGAATYNRLWRACGGRVVACTQVPVVGVTGRSGTGKSALATLLADRGATLVDADKIYARLAVEDAGMLGKIFTRFPSALGPHGALNRRALGAAVFGNPAALQDLNAITHPHVLAEIERLMHQGAGPFVLDVPVLFGSGLDRLCTATVGVLAPLNQAAARIMARDGIDEAAALGRLKAQQPDDFFKERCDFIVENSGSRDALQAAADALAQKLGLWA